MCHQLDLEVMGLKIWGAGWHARRGDSKSGNNYGDIPPGRSKPISPRQTGGMNASKRGFELN